MRRLPRMVFVALQLLVAAPAFAQYTFSQPGQPQTQPVDVYKNVVRVNLGVGFYNGSWYNYYCYGYYYPYCTSNSGSYTSYIPFLVGPQIDFNLGGPNNLSVGFDVLIGTISTTAYVGGISQSASKSVTIWEPTIDYVAKFGPPTQDTVGRFRVGGGMYIGPNSGIGGAFRIGGGASFLNSKRLGIGLDLVLEGGGYEGYWIGALQLMASPEFHF